VSKRRLGKWLRRTAIGSLAFVLLLFLLWLFRFPVFGGLIHHSITDALMSAGIEAEYDELTGTLLGDFTVEGFAISDSPGFPAIKAASVGRIHARYSLLGLLLGEDRWIREVLVEDVTLALDLAAPPPATLTATEESEPLGIDLLPGHVRLDGLNLTVDWGEEHFHLSTAGFSADANKSGGIVGAFGAEETLLRVRGQEYRATGATGDFEVLDGVARILHVTADGRRHPEPVHVDLSGLDRDEIDARLDFPLFGGRFTAKIEARLGLEHPAGQAWISITEVDPKPVLAFLPDLPAGAVHVTAKLSVSASGEVEPDLSSIEGRFELHVQDPYYEDHRVQSIVATGAIADGRATASGRIADPGGAFELEVDLVGEGPLKGRLLVPRLDLKQLRLGVGDHLATGLLRIEASVTGTVQEPSLSFEVELDSPALGEFDADSIVLRGGGDLDQVDIASLSLIRGNDHVSLQGTVHPGTEPIGFSGTVHAEIQDLGTYRKFISAPLPGDLTGRVLLDVTADGNADEPGATVTATLTGAGAAGLFTERIEIILKAPTPDHIEVRRLALTGRGHLPDLVVADATIQFLEQGVDVEAPSIVLSREDCGFSATAHADIRPTGEMTAGVSIEGLDLGALGRHFGLELPAGGILSGTISASGTPDSPQATVDLEVRNLSADLPGLNSLAVPTATIKGRFENDLVTLDTLLVRGEGFEIHAAGRIPLSLTAPGEVAAAPVDGTVRILSLPLDIAGPLPGIGTIHGTLDATLTISGRADDPRVSGELSASADRLAIPGFPGLEISDMAMLLKPEDLGRQGGRVRVEHFRLEVAGARVAATGSVAHAAGSPLDPQLELVVTAIDLGRIGRVFGVDLPIEGRAVFGLNVTPGPVAVLNLKVTELALPNNPGMTLDLGGEWREGTFAFTEGRLENRGRSIDIAGRVPFDLSLDPFRAAASPDREMDVSLRVSGLDLATLGLEADGIRLAGRTDADLSIKGLLTKPKPSGVLTLTDVRFRAAGVPGIDKLSGTIAFDPDLVRIEDLTGTLGRGAFSVAGTVAIENGGPGAADLTIKAENAQLIRNEGMRLRTDLDLTVQGTDPSDLTVGGTIKVRSLRVGATGLLAIHDLETVLAAVRSSPRLATLPLTTDPTLKDVKLDLTLQIPEGAVHVRNNLVKATAKGKLKIGGTLAVPRPRGRIYVPEGTVFLIAGRLELDKSIITFKESDPLVPYIDGRATARVSNVDVFVNVSGPVNKARVLLSSVPSYPAPDIVSLILTGATRSNLGSDALQGMASTYLLRQLSSSFSGDDGEESTFSDMLNRVEVEFDDRKTGSGGIPGFTATARILDWLFVRGRQESALDYGFDLIFRLTFP